MTSVYHRLPVLFMRRLTTNSQRDSIVVIVQRGQAYV